MEDNLHEKKKFFGNLKNLYEILTWIRERLAQYFNQKDLEMLELACEEVIVNIMKHGYKTKDGPVYVEITVNHHVFINIKDKGIKFNPLLFKSKKINKNQNLEKTAEGGFGILLILKCVDEVKYKREEPFNILTLMKKRSLNY